MCCYQRIQTRKAIQNNTPKLQRSKYRKDHLWESWGRHTLSPRECQPVRPSLAIWHRLPTTIIKNPTNHQTYVNFSHLWKQQLRCFSSYVDAGDVVSDADSLSSCSKCFIFWSFTGILFYHIYFHVLYGVGLACMAFYIFQVLLCSPIKHSLQSQTLSHFRLLVLRVLVFGDYLKWANQST